MWHQDNRKAQGLKTASFDFYEALSVLTFQNDKNVLISAKEYLESN